ncbi:hypothetical protein ACQPZX_29385 [Actinoplanes sp. CA-142083]|uniref:hypothetical protein n=1 Tax=Actinoplanes sp. CA-142083 TaxID=3239903 RepID=UPI003D8E6D12
MRRRVVEDPAAQVEVPMWITHLEVGLRHIGSVDEHGTVSLDGVDRLNARRDAWLRERGLDPRGVL